MMREWEKNLRKVEPYVAGEQPNEEDMIKLNTNECPYPPAPSVDKCIKEMNTDQFRLYPELGDVSLIHAIAEYYGVEDANVFVGVGSDDVIANAFLSFFNSDLPILFPDITYSFYPVWADLYKIPYEKQPLDADFHIRVSDYKKENGGIIFPNPNAPTGLYESLDVVEEILKANQKSVVIVDEAYIDFGGISALELIEKYENLLVIQTFSKSRSMAGMRIGYAIGHPSLIEVMKAVKNSINSYTMSRANAQTAIACIAEKEYFEMVTGKIIKTREACKEQLRELGFSFPDSKANFIFATHKELDITSLYEYLRTKHIYVRHWNQPAIKDYLRISIGTDEEMERFFEEVKKYQEGIC